MCNMVFALKLWTIILQSLRLKLLAAIYADNKMSDTDSRETASCSARESFFVLNQWDMHWYGMYTLSRQNYFNFFLISFQ